ncbi:hypothetical protein ACH33_10720 [Aneurinibacillus sp. XH2]|nr:hypothetical protein ACH33_10720 [Aneurinibacillus sp. XH2]
MPNFPISINRQKIYFISVFYALPLSEAKNRGKKEQEFGAFSQFFVTMYQISEMRATHAHF